MRKSIIAVTMGDPAGIGPEIILKSLGDPAIFEQAEIIICGSATVANDRIKRLGLPFTLELENKSTDFFAEAGIAACYRLIGAAGVVRLWEPMLEATKHTIFSTYNFPSAALEEARVIQDGRLPSQPGQITAGNGLLAFLYIEIASRACLEGRADAMATAPLHKEAIHAAAVPFIGHTEILGGMCGVADPLTMFETRGLRIFFHSRHVSLRKACDLVTRERVLASLHRCHDAMAGLGLASRRIAVAGLNPHCGEHGLFGDEDDIHVATAVADACAAGIDAHGPIGSDSVFYQARTGAWDAVLSLYHDQGHIAAKTWDFDRTISVTLGLPYLRSSVDHGTAMDIAGTGKARETSMTEAILVAARYVAARHLHATELPVGPRDTIS